MTDVSARKNSKCLRVYCERCYVDPAKVLTDNVQTLVNFVYKIDMAIQKQSENFKNVETLLSKSCDENAVNNNKLHEQIEYVKVQIGECGSKLQEIVLNKHEAHGDRRSANDGKNPTFAKVVSTGTALIVQPKKKEQNSMITKEMLKRVVGADDMGVSDIKTLPNGAVLIQCRTKDGLSEIENRVKQHDAENYTTKEKKSMNCGKIKIVGMTKKREENELSVLISSQFELGENEYVKVLKVYADKNTRSERFNAIVEVSNALMEEMVQKGRLIIDWDECKVHK